MVFYTVPMGNHGGETTCGIFDPKIYKEDYWKTGGHDILFILTIKRGLGYI